ncbi:MAG: DedA family protein [Dehalococcoidia bacterium]
MIIAQPFSVYMQSPACARPQESRLDLIVDIVTAPYDALNWLADVLFVAVDRLFERYGTPIVFFSALAEATVGLGVVFPGLVVMFLGGAVAAHGDASLFSVLAVAIAGTALGDTLSYAAGRWGGERLGRTRFGPWLRMGEEIMRGRARWLIPFYHLHNATRAVGPFGAGALRIPLRTWLPLDYLGAVISNSVWVGAGFVLGTAVLTEDGKLNEHPAVRLGLAAVAAVWFMTMHYLMSRRMREIEARDAAATQSGEAEPKRVAASD